MASKSPQEDFSSHQATTRGVATRTVSADKKEPPLQIGGVVVKDREGREISGWTSAVCGGNWIALPVWSLLRGKNLVFQSAESEEIPIEKGIWESGDPLIILKLESDQKGIIPDLIPWKQYKPLVWRSLLKKDFSFQVDISSPDKKGSYLSFPLPYEIQETGVFTQDEHVVGWTFPDQLEKGYLWSGLAGVDLIPNIQMNQFFHSVIADWRETHFENVLNRGVSIPSIRRMEAFADGLRMDSRFSEEDVPQQLRPQSIMKQMHSLASELIKNGMATEVARILDEHIIIEAQNLALVKDSVLARVETEDYHKALQFLERFKKNIFEIKGQGISGLSQFHVKLYKDWLRKILNQGGYYSGMVAFEEAKRVFPDDIELHLLGVEVALAEKNWARARELLQMRDYPESMRDWVGELENNIQEVQENEGAVTIRFNPGSKHIPVKVYLNGTHSFQFILDTGATMCSIPSSAVDRLRIDIDQATPILVSTAGGYAETYVVKLKSIELEGFRVSNVEAMIIDIPGYWDYGLLGQNFINNFHIEIDNQKSILRLKKR
jgi:clan AA aspartic protease (TIGR02281 family)